MSNVIELDAHRIGWATGMVRCDACQHEWISVFHPPLLGAIDCPECMRSMGWPKWPLTSGKEIFTCGDCEGTTFQLVRNDGLMCCRCGSLREVPNND